MREKLFILFLLLLHIKAGVYSQSLRTGNLYINNNYSINPAYAGNQSYINTYLSFRKTASSIPGTPTILSFGISSQIHKNTSLGGRFYKQSEGLFNTIIGFADYSYRIKLSTEQKIRFGISAGFNSNQLNHSNIIAENPSAIIDIASRSFEGFSFQGSAGLIYNWKNFEWSLSIPQIFESKSNFKPSYNTFISYDFKLQNKNIDLKPSFFLIYKPNTPLLYDLNLQAYWKKQFWIAASYRNRPSIILSAGLNYNNIGFSYAIELSTEKYSNMFTQIHEISISYAIKKQERSQNKSNFEPLYQLLEKKDIIVPDKVSDISVIETSSPDTSSTDKSNVKINQLENENENHEILETGKGIYTIKSIKEDSLVSGIDNTELNFVENSKFAEDSALANKLVKQIEKKEKKKNYNLTKIGAGIYTIKSFNKINSSNKDTELSDKMLDSLIYADNLLNQMNLENDQKISNNEPFQSEYYTIRLFISAKTNHLLTKAEIIDNIRVKTNKHGSINYFYGYFISEEEANVAKLELAKFKELELKVIKINSKN